MTELSDLQKAIQKKVFLTHSVQGWFAVIYMVISLVLFLLVRSQESTLTAAIVFAMFVTVSIFLYFVMHGGIEGDVLEKIGEIETLNTRRTEKLEKHLEYLASENLLKAAGGPQTKDALFGLDGVFWKAGLRGLARTFQDACDRQEWARKNYIKREEEAKLDEAHQQVVKARESFWIAHDFLKGVYRERRVPDFEPLASFDKALEYKI